MAQHAFMCPQCNGPLSPTRFARSVVCSYCGATVTIDETAVSAAVFKQAFEAWNAPRTHGITDWLAVGDSRWSPGELIAHGEISDVHAAQRARWPSERALVKVLRDERDRALFDHEWEVLERLHGETAEGAAGMLARLPEPIAHGVVTDGMYVGAQVTVLRWASGFRHTVEDFRRAYPAGIDPQPSIWVWRRLLEVLAFLHKQGYAHGAVLPPHLLVEDGEHGLRLVGLSMTDRMGARLRGVVERWADFYPQSEGGPRTVGAAADVAMSARCLIALLGGDPATGKLPDAVPGPLASLLRDTAAADAPSGAAPGAWSLREQLGALAREVFGPSRFCPLVMPR
jgi:hypothetical protein